jgi:2'-5' RNA ligase
MRDQDRSALVVLVPEAEAMVADLRERFDVSGVSGLAAHITVLFPFAHPAFLTTRLRDTARSLFDRQRPFRFSLAGVCGFPRIVYLAPEPLAPFDSLTREAAACFPDHPPYGGVFAEPVPHLTVAQEPLAKNLFAITSDLLDRAASITVQECRADEVALAVKRDGRWSIEDRFRFGGSSAD